MKLVALALVFIAGCDLYCSHDSDCDHGEVCAHDNQCLSTDQVYDVHITWTIDGQSPSGATCNLSINFSNGNYKDDFGYLPLPCAEGEFSIPKLPTDYATVELELADGNDSQTMSIARDGTANFDLAVTLDGG
jgi:hypothetical protein